MDESDGGDENRNNYCVFTANCVNINLIFKHSPQA